MPLEFTFSCPLPNGVHARPASALEEVASSFGADVMLTNHRTGRTANAKSVLAIVGADIRKDDDCRLQVSGADENEAMAALATFLRDEFPLCDESLPPSRQTNGEFHLPPLLQNAGATIRHGVPLVKGIGRGPIVQVGGLRIPDGILANGTADFATEVRKVDTALAALVASYEERLPNAASRVEADILKAHRSVARDPEFRAYLHERLRHEHRNAAAAIADAEAYFVAMLLNSESALLRERALDVRDVCFQLLRQIYGKAALPEDVTLNQPAVVVADFLTPGQFLALGHRFLNGLVLGHGGSTSHTVILARSFGIPTLVGVPDLARLALHGAEAVADAERGLLVTDLSSQARRYYELEQRRLTERRARQEKFAGRPAATSDGKHLEIGANISTAAEAPAAFEAGAESIGLFRTEMLFLDRDEPPTEDEQYAAYCSALTAARDCPVILRTLDIGGDKPLAYLNLPTEDNPFLGYRAVRIYPEFESIFRTQVRALVRASAHGALQVMIPMVTTLDELRWAKRIIREEQERCAREGIACKKTMPVGVMIEVPSAAFMIDQLCTEADFFSIGSNDLLQYFAGADRANPRVAKLYDPLQPAFLRLLKKIADEARAGKRRVGLCGEMGGQTRCLPLLVGLGLDEISAAASAVTELKAELSLWETASCQELTRRALDCATADEVRQLLDDYAARRPSTLTEPELILVESDCASKEEAIKEMVDRLYVLGRTDQPGAIEDAVWQRETVYSTGFGHGFAIPHCKTSAVAANSLVLLKPRRPVPWGSLDNQPVNVLLLLIVRDPDLGNGNGHMKIFSKLARKVMHEEFREQLTRETNPASLCALLNQSLNA